MPETGSAYAVLGRQVVITGEIRSREPLTIEGELEGTIDVSGHRLTVAAGGKVRASVKAKEIDVHGSLQGRRHHLHPRRSTIPGRYSRTRHRHRGRRVHSGKRGSLPSPRQVKASSYKA
jgi:Polymer-forming cytoskeletal